MNQEEQREAERFEKMTNAIHRAVLETSKNNGELVAINFPVTLAALLNVVIAMAALDPGLNPRPGCASLLTPHGNIDQQHPRQAGVARGHEA